MNNKLLLHALFTTALITGSLQQVSAQDSTRTRPAAVKPKPAVTQPAVTKPAARPGTAYPQRTTTAPRVATPAPTNAAGMAQPYTRPAPVSVTPVAPNDRSINGQYQYLLSKIYNYQRPMVAAFYKSVTDSINAQKKRIKPLASNVATLNDSLKTLHTQLSSQEQNLSESSAKVDSISLLGIPMAKSTYNTLMWGLVLVFGAVAAFVIFRSGSYNREAKYRIKLYEELDEEYKSYKIKANEKEKKLARDLQTARNKLEEITGKPEY